jgi:transcriptional regulator with XRE-family HTH domain
LRFIREGRGWTLKQLAAKTNGKYAFQTIAGYEKATDKLPEEFLKVMAEVLGVSQESIFHPEPAGGGNYKIREPGGRLWDEEKVRSAFNLQDIGTQYLEQIIDFMIQEYRDAKDVPSDRRAALANLAAAADELRRRLTENPNLEVQTLTNSQLILASDLQKMPENLGAKSPPSARVASHTDTAAEPATHTDQRSDGQQTPPVPAPK